MSKIGHSSRKILVCLPLILVTGCGGGERRPTTTTTSSADGSVGASIGIRDYKYVPAAITVKAGDTITVENHESVEHTVTASDRSFDSGPLGAGQTARFAPAAPGTVEYHCSIHPYMNGTIKVEASSP